MGPIPSPSTPTWRRMFYRAFAPAILILAATAAHAGDAPGPDKRPPPGQPGAHSQDHRGGPPGCHVQPRPIAEGRDALRGERTAVRIEVQGDSEVDVRIRPRHPAPPGARGERPEPRPHHRHGMNGEAPPPMPCEGPPSRLCSALPGWGAKWSSGPLKRQRPPEGGLSTREPDVRRQPG